MGSVFSELVVLLCRNSCRPSAVTSLLTFYPPEPPHYTLTQNVGGRITMTVDQDLPSVHFPSLEVHQLTTSRGDEIVSFLYKFPGARYTVLFSHGNAADCGSMQTAYVELCQRIGVNVFAYDYTGYGSSSGRASEAATYADIEAAYDFLVSSGLCPQPDKQIVLYGQSVGSGPSCFLAASKKRPVRAMVLHTPIMSGLRVIMANRGPLCCCDPFPNITRIKDVTAPVLVIHGDADAEVDFSHGHSLHKNVPDHLKVDPLWIEGADHHNIAQMFGPQYFSKLHEFFHNLEGEDYTSGNSGVHSPVHRGLQGSAEGPRRTNDTGITSPSAVQPTLQVSVI